MKQIKVAIIYHSGYGHTHVIAEHVLAGARQVKNCSADLFTVKELKGKLDILKDYDAMIFGSPTYMGSVTAAFKEFMEESSKPWFTQDWKDKLAAGFTNSLSLSGDKLNTLVQLFIFASQHSMNWISLGHLNQSGKEGVPSGDIQAVNRLGSYSGLMAQSENVSPDQSPGEGDQKSARLLGQRVAEAALRWNR